MLHQTGEFIRLKKKKMVIFLFVVQGDVVLPALLSKNTDLEKIYTYPCNGSNWGNARRMNHRTENLIRGREDCWWDKVQKEGPAKTGGKGWTDFTGEAESGDDTDKVEKENVPSEAVETKMYKWKTKIRQHTNKSNSLHNFTMSDSIWSQHKLLRILYVKESQ